MRTGINLSHIARAACGYDHLSNFVVICAIAFLFKEIFIIKCNCLSYRLLELLLLILCSCVTVTLIF